MNIHLLPHKTANHNILATELLVEHEESTSHDALKDFWRFGVHSAILISSLLHGVAHSLGHQHGVLGRDGGANGYPTACPQEVNPLQGTVMSIRVGASSAVWVDKHLDWISLGKPTMPLAWSLSRLCFGRSARRTFVNALRCLCSDD